MATTGAATITVSGHPLKRPNDSALVASALLELLGHVPGGSRLVPGTVYQMGLVAHAVGLTPRLAELLASNWGTLGADVGTGAVGIYFACQVNNYVKS
jgi:hypothetical protein